MTEDTPVLTTHALVARVRSGDPEALNALCGRFLPRLRRWARGRLPRTARSLIDTDDLAQEVIVRTLRHVGHLEAAHQGALHAYLRCALDNRIREEIRRTRRIPPADDLDSAFPADDASPLLALIGRDAFERYEAALERLPPRDREALVLRMELGASHAEVAEELDLPSAEAARKVVSRALLKLAHGMQGGRS